jgi:hypothetical protein
MEEEAAPRHEVQCWETFRTEEETHAVILDRIKSRSPSGWTARAMSTQGRRMEIKVKTESQFVIIHCAAADIWRDSIENGVQDEDADGRVPHVNPELRCSHSTEVQSEPRWIEFPMQTAQETRHDFTGNSRLLTAPTRYLGESGRGTTINQLGDQLIVVGYMANMGRETLAGIRLFNRTRGIESNGMWQ